MNIDEQIRIMQAYRDGAEIEVQSKTALSGWRSVRAPSWNWEEISYRVKEKPKTVTLRYYRFSDGEVKIFDLRPFDVIPYNGKPPELIYTQTIEVSE